MQSLSAYQLHPVTRIWHVFGNMIFGVRVRETSVHGAQEIDVAGRKQHQQRLVREVAVEQPRLRSVQKRPWGSRSPPP